MAQTQQYKPKLRLFRIRNLFYYRNIVLYYHKCNIFDNIKNIIAILDALALTDYDLTSFLKILPLTFSI